MVRIRGGHHESPLDLRADPGLFHQLGHRVHTDIHLLFNQLGMHTRAAVKTAALVIRLANLPSQLLRANLPLTDRTIQPSVITTAAHLQHVAHHIHRVTALLLPDPRKLHVGWLAKKAVAFFKISFSISNRRTRADNSLSCALSTAGSSLGWVD